MRTTDGVLDSTNKHHQVDTMVQCCCYGRVPTACQTEERSVCVEGKQVQIQWQVHQQQWRLLKPSDNSLWVFFELIMDKRWNHRSSFRCALRPWHIPGRESVGFLQVNLTLSPAAHFEAISSTLLHHSQYWNSGSPGSTMCQPVLEFLVPMCPE